MKPHQVWQNFSDQLDRDELVKPYFLFETVPDMLFFIVDRDIRLIRLNQNFSRLLGSDKPESLIGQCMYDYYPDFLVELYKVDHEYVLNGNSITNQIRLALRAPFQVGWFHSNKIPLMNRQGEVIGMAGTCRDMKKDEQLIESGSQLGEIVTFIKDRFDQKICVRDIANHVHLSVSAVEKIFKRHYNTSPMKYLKYTRLHHAAELLTQTSKTLTEISLETGFSDQSYFTREFRRYMNITPLKYRAMAI